MLASGCSHCRMGVSLDPWCVPDIVHLGLSIGWRFVCAAPVLFVWYTTLVCAIYGKVIEPLPAGGQPQHKMDVACADKDVLQHTGCTTVANAKKEHVQSTVFNMNASRMMPHVYCNKPIAWANRKPDEVHCRSSTCGIAPLRCAWLCMVGAILACKPYHVVSIHCLRIQKSNDAIRVWCVPRHMAACGRGYFSIPCDCCLLVVLCM